MAKKKTTTRKRNRRTDEQMISDLQAQIEKLKRRAQSRKAKKSPSLKHTLDAVRKVDMALAASPEMPLKKALSEAREPLAAFLQMEGIQLPKRRGRKPKDQSDELTPRPRGAPKPREEAGAQPVEAR
jgi:hypothetical protein